MKTFLRLYAILAICFAAVAAHAHFLWATYSPETKQFSLQFAESPGDSVLKNVAEKKDVVIPTVASKPLAMKMDAAGEMLVAPANSSEAFGATLHYGVIDRGGVFFLEYTAKAAANVKASQISQGLKLEMSVLERKGSDVKLEVQFDGKVAANADVVVYVNNGEDTIETKTDSKGVASVNIPEGQPIVARALVTEKKSGTAEGKAYDSVKYYTSLTVW